MTHESHSHHPWKFWRAGGFEQVRLETGPDLAHLAELDQKLWVALACPTSGLEFDPKTLALIDADHDGRIRPPEIIAATQWACANLKNPEDLFKGEPALPLASIQEATPEGRQLLGSARQILANLGKKDARSSPSRTSPIRPKSSPKPPSTAMASSRPKLPMIRPCAPF